MAYPFGGFGGWNPIRHGNYHQDPFRPFPSTTPKVVNIPVHFVRSGNDTREQSPAQAAASAVENSRSRVAAAVSIQRIVRGFLVRKNARIVRQIALDVDKIEREVRKAEAKIRLDPRERLRLSEELMRLLLRLDSVRGVRNLRKKVIGRVIGLQEAIDSISSDGDGKISANDGPDDQEVLVGGEAEKSSMVHDRTPDSPDTDLTKPGKEADDKLGLMVEQVESEAKTDLEKEIPVIESSKGESDLFVPANGKSSTTGISEILEKSEMEICDRNTFTTKGVTEVQTETRSEANLEAEDEFLDAVTEANNNEKGAEDENRADIRLSKGNRDLISIGPEEHDPTQAKSGNVKPESMVVEQSEETKELKEMMARMAAENESLKLLVAQLCQSSAEQCRLMEGLADRVSRLERLRRKKRKSGAACTGFPSAK